MLGLAALFTLAPFLAGPAAEATVGTHPGARQALCDEARAIAELPPCAGPRGCAASERFTARFGPPRTSEAEAAGPEGAVITFPDRRPLRRTPWPPPVPVPVAPCPAGTGAPP
jgi:hypothetical protein